MATTLAEIIAEASAHADRTALIIGDTAWTYANLDKGSDRIADGLVALDVMPGDRVSIFGANSFEWIAAYYGAAKVGAVVNPLSSMLTEDELRYTVEDAGARVVIASGDKAPALRTLKAAGIIDHAVIWGSETADETIRLEGWLRKEGTRFSIRPRDPADARYCLYLGHNRTPEGRRPEPSRRCCGGGRHGADGCSDQRGSHH